MTKITGIQSLLTAIVLTTSLAACHSSANDNTSRPCVPDENGNNIGNDEITENRSMGNDANPRNVMWDGVTSPEEKIGGNFPHNAHEGHKRHDDKETHEESKEKSGHGHH
ncbi:MAG TPA: hypothetical protein VF868_06550 [Bacteroidia bacterium]|jgi:hypothetical protein